MSELREIVDEANKLLTQRITLKEGKRPSFFTIKGSVEPKKFNPLTTADIDHLFNSIFVQAGNLLHHQRHARKFKILELGEVDCIGLTDLRQINIYLARGAALYTLDYAQFFPKSSRDSQQEQEDDASEANAAVEGSGDNTRDKLMNTMVSLNGEISGIDLLSAAPPPSNTSAQTTPLSEAASTGAPQPDSASDTSSPLSEAASTGAPQPDSASDTSSDEGGALGLQILLTPQDDAAASTPPADTTTPPPDVSDMLQVQDESETPEGAGVHTARNKVATQPDQVVTETDATAEDGSSQLAAAIAPQAVVAKQTSSAPTLNGTSDVSDGSHAIDKLLKEMMVKRASDLHLSCDHPIMMRIGGQMEKVNAKDKITLEALQNWLNPIIPAVDAAKLEQSGDIDFTYELQGVGRFRVNVLKDLHGIGAVLRYVPAALKTLEALAAPAIVKKFCYLSKGLVIINGPAGSGRSTTMAAMINVINITRKTHLLSIEDPIEFVHAQKNSLIRQREIGTHTHSALEGLRAALREDTDIICTDEIREAAAMLMAMKCAEAGRLVFSMVHTRNSISAIDSIVNQFTPAHQNQARHLLANTLRGVICQTLVRKKNGGQVAAWEVLIVSNEVAAMIKTGRTQQITSHMIAHRVKGNILLNDSLLKLVSENTVSFNNALIAATDKRALHALAHRRGLKLSA